MSFAVSLFLLLSIAGGQEAQQAGPQEADRLDKQGLPGTQALQAYMTEIRKSGATPVRDWDKK